MGSREVAVLYYRSGYDPSFYHGEEEWGVRLLLERSRAIKCPSVEYHLAGTKKVGTCKFTSDAHHSPTLGKGNCLRSFHMRLMTTRLYRNEVIHIRVP